MPRGRPIPPDVAVRLLEEVESLNLPTFLFGGTLLGAIREGRILSEDWDVDVAMLAEHWDEAALGRTDGLTIGRVRRWGRETPWALGRVVETRWRGTPSLVKLEHGPHHVDLHILAPGTDPEWRYWQRGPGDETLMRTPAALLTDSSFVEVDGRKERVPARSPELLTYCYGHWHTPVPASDWYGSPEFQRIHAERTVTMARAA